MEFNDRELPFKLSSMTKGAQKAYIEFLKQYGIGEGRRIYLAKAEEHGVGTTIRQKVNSVYKKGGEVR